MKYKELEVFEDKHLRIISHDRFLVIYNEETQELTVHSGIKVNLDFCKDLALNVEGDLDITVDGEINFHSTEDLSIDSKNVYLNSGTSKQIRSNLKQINSSGE